MLFHATSRKDGWISWDRANLNRRVAFVSKMEDGTPLDILIRKHRKKRSDAQRGYYFGYLVKTIQNSDLVHDPGENGKNRVHEGLKAKFLMTEDPVFGWRIKSTNELSTAEAEVYHQEIRTWAEVAHQVLLLPNEVEIDDDWNESE